MALDQITLTTFRNHAETTLENTRRFNLFVGENGAGKTNLLEALSLFAPGRGLRRAPLAQMALSGSSGGFAIGASLTLADGQEPVRLGTFTDALHPGRRRVRVNSQSASAASLSEWLSIGWLTPAMDGLFTDSAGARRRFLDRLTLALDPAHSAHVSRYENALRERNRLLAGDTMPDPAWLDGIETQLARFGALVIAGRITTVTALEAELASLPDEPFARPSLARIPGSPEDEAELRQALCESRQRDRAAARTLVGPHRDDLDVRMSGRGIEAANCSTGEQKAMLIAIILAHAERAANGRPFLLLLDEIAAHLDPLRRAALFERLRASGAQIWLSGTEAAPFETIHEESAIWAVSDGEVTQLQTANIYAGSAP